MRSSNGDVSTYTDDDWDNCDENDAEMRLCVVTQLAPRHDGEELDDAGHGMGLGARQGHQHCEQQQRPVRDVALERLVHVCPALGGEAERHEGGDEQDHQRDQGLPATVRGSVVADGAADSKQVWFYQFLIQLPHH